MDLPVLIYIAKYRCPACIHYEKEWQKVMDTLQGRARFVKFECYAGGRNLPPPAVLEEYSEYFPSIVLAGPKSYYRCFTDDDQVNAAKYSNEYRIKGLIFNRVKSTGRGYEFGGRANSAENTVNWFNQVVASIPQIDDQSPS